MSKDKQPTLFGMFDQQQLAPGARLSSTLPPHQRHSETSVAAAKAVAPALAAMDKAVYDYIVSRGTAGSTDNEGIIAMLPTFSTIANTYRGRRISLVEKGLVEATGKRVNGNREAVVYTATSVIKGEK